ncbi:unnamed protein product, partial [Prorocentrum cordatum]
EPLSLVTAVARLSSKVRATVYGTRYPWPELLCQLFGHCAANGHIDEAVGLLVRQMYRPVWEFAELLRELHEGMRSDGAFQEMELLVCAQPMAICAMMRGLTDKPMLVYQAFPLVGATPAALSHALLLNFREMARHPRSTAFVAYSEFLAQQFAFQVGHQPLCIRPHSLYATSYGNLLYFPDRESPRIFVSRMAGWARDGAHAMVYLLEYFAERELGAESGLRFVFLGVVREPSALVAGVAQPFGYAELRRFRAAVYFPWDMGMLLFSELYSIGVPLLVPGRAWMASIIKRMLEYTDFGWWQARAETAAALPGAGGAAQGGPSWWPWLDANSTVGEILALYDLTDFVRWPYVEAFDSLPALMRAVRGADFDKCSEDMRRWNEASLQRSLGIASRALAALLGGPAGAPRAESSCL